MNKMELIDYLLEKEAEYKEDGFVPTLGLLIKDLQEETTQ